MSIEEDLVTTLGPVFSGRFYPMVAPANVSNGTSPYSVYQLVSGIPENTVDGATPNLTNARYQISIFGRDMLELVALVKSAKTAMLASALFKSLCVMEMDSFEDPALLYAKLIDFSIWHYDN